jgi:hypothetical protein
LRGRVAPMTTPPRRWFQFGLRTTFVVVTLVAMPLGWVAYNLNWMRRRDSALERLYELCPTITYEEGEDIPPYVEAPWPLQFFGDHSVTIRDWPLPLAEGDPELQRLRAVFPELRLLAHPTH